jgi:hypothetical protein
MTAWQREAKAYILSEVRGHAGKLNATNCFLDFLIEHPLFARDPIALVKDGGLPADYGAWILETRGLRKLGKLFAIYKCRGFIS